MFIRLSQIKILNSLIILFLIFLTIYFLYPIDGRNVDSAADTAVLLPTALQIQKQRAGI